MSTTRPLVVVDARASLGTTPGIVLEALGDGTVLDLLLHRLAPLRQVEAATTVVATSDLAVDDPIVEVARAHGLATVRGPDADPLDALAVALVRHDADEVVHVAATGPLGDPFVVAAALAAHRSAEADLTTNRLPRTYPQGLEVDVFSARALRAAAIEATDPIDRARATRFLVRRPERFRLANLASNHDASAERWVAGDRSELRRLADLLAQVPDAHSASWNRILAVTGRRNRPAPGDVVLRALPSAPPGANPWERRWSVHIDGHEVGSVGISVGSGRSTRDAQVGPEHREAALAALYRILLDDDQAAP